MKQTGAFAGRFPRLLLALCALQPCLDVLAFWKDALGIPDLALTLVRMLMFSALVLTGFCLSRRKRYYLILAGLSALYLAGHILAAAGMGYEDPVRDLTDQLRFLLLPAVTLALMTLARRDARVLPALWTGLVLDLGLILLVVILSVLTGTDPHTYLGKQTGILGWFLWANSQSAILSMLAPAAIAWAYTRYKGRLLPLGLVTLVSLGLLFALGTRLAFFAMALSGLGMAVCLLLAPGKTLRPALVVLVLTLVFTALYPVSPTHSTQQKLGENAVVKQERIAAAVAPYGVPAEARTTQNREALAAAYRYFIQGTVDRFGIDRTAQAYDYTLDQGVIYDGRLKKLTFNRLLMEEAPALNHLFGLEVSRMEQSTQIYDFYADSWSSGVEVFAVENDAAGLYYSGGVALPLLMGPFLLGIGLFALLSLIRRGRKPLSPAFAGFAGAYCFFVIYACTTNSVLRQTSDTLYAGIILAGLWALSRRDGGQEETAL